MLLTHSCHTPQFIGPYVKIHKTFVLPSSDVELSMKENCRISQSLAMFDCNQFIIIIIIIIIIFIEGAQLAKAVFSGALITLFTLNFQVGT